MSNKTFEFLQGVDVGRSEIISKLEELHEKYESDCHTNIGEAYYYLMGEIQKLIDEANES